MTRESKERISRHLSSTHPDGGKKDTVARRFGKRIYPYFVFVSRNRILDFHTWIQEQRFPPKSALRREVTRVHVGRREVDTMTCCEENSSGGTQGRLRLGGRSGNAKTQGRAPKTQIPDG